MKIPAKVASFLGVFIMLLAVFYAQAQSMRNQHEVNLVKSIKNI